MIAVWGGKNRETGALCSLTQIYWEQALKKTHIRNVSLFICCINLLSRLQALIRSLPPASHALMWVQSDGQSVKTVW